MRISDWSSDVCSSDLAGAAARAAAVPAGVAGSLRGARAGRHRSRGGLTPRTGAPARRRIPTRDGSMSMQDLSRISGARQQRALWLSTFALAVCFAVWVIFSIVGIQLQQDLGLSGTQFGLLVAAPLLTGSIRLPVPALWAAMIGAPPVL